MVRLARSLVYAVLALGACAGGPAQLEVKITSDPPALAEVASVVLTIARVEAHVVAAGTSASFTPSDTSIEADDLWRVVTASPRERDLAMLAGGQTGELGQIEGDEGQVNQIRIGVAIGGRNAVTRKDGTSCAIDVSGVPAGGFRVAHAAAAIPVEIGRKTSILLDLPLSESLAREGDCLYRLTPVLKIKSFQILGKDSK